MTLPSNENNHLPIYEDLVLELGDAVAEAQLAADHMQYQAAELLTGRDAVHQAHRWEGNARATTSGQPEWLSSPS